MAYYRAHLTRPGQELIMWLTAASLLEAQKQASEKWGPYGVHHVSGPFSEQDYRNALAIPSDEPV
jgi:hypothetical protein